MKGYAQYKFVPIYILMLDYLSDQFVCLMNFYLDLEIKTLYTVQVMYILCIHEACMFMYVYVYLAD